MDTSSPPANHFEDFTPGMTFHTPEIAVEADDIVRFAGQFDPQPFHLDARAAESSFFGTLVASGWHTAALTMRLMVESNLAIAGGLIGGGGEIKWPAALKPGDRIHVDIEIVATRPLRSRPAHGILSVRSQTVTQDGTVVQDFTANLFVPRRVPADATPASA